MKFIRGLPMLAALAAALALSASGCIWLAAPSLAYQGYEGESGKKPSEQQAPGRQPKKPSPPQPSAPGSNIE